MKGDDYSLSRTLRIASEKCDCKALLLRVKITKFIVEQKFGKRVLKNLLHWDNSYLRRAQIEQSAKQQNNYDT